MFNLNITNETENDTSISHNDDDGSQTKILKTLINDILTPVILTTGIIANAISFLIIVKSDFRKSSIGIYLAGLALFDSLVLIVTSVNTFLAIASYFHTTKIFCKMYFVLIFVGNFVSAWILTATTCERCYIITNPYSMVSNETLRKRAYKLLMFIVLFSIILYIHLAVTYDAIGIPVNFDIVSGKVRYVYVCTYKPKYAYFGLKIFSWIHLAAFCIVPSSIIFICNIIIIFFIIEH